MGCKCSKEEEQGEAIIEDEDEEYEIDNNIDEYENTDNIDKLDNFKSSGLKNTNKEDYNANNKHENINEEEKDISNIQNTHDISDPNNNDNNNTNTNTKTKKKKKVVNNISKTKQNTADSILEQSQTPSMMNYETSFAKKKKKSKNDGPNHKYTTEVIKLFNIARNKPLSFCKHIDYCIDLITTNEEGQLVIGSDKTNKIALKDGISKFNEFKRCLLQLDSCPELRYDSNLEIDISDDIELWLDNDYIKNQILDKQVELLNANMEKTSSTAMSKGERSEKKNEYSIFGFHFEYGMTDPVISSVLQLVDDNNCENRRRYNIMNSEYKAVGVTNKTIGKRFIAYFFFAG